MVAVDVNRFQRPRTACDVQPIGAAGDVCTHLRRSIDETDITLDRISAYTLYANAVGGSNRSIAFSNGPQRNEVTRRRSVSLHMDRARRLVTAARWNGETLPTIALHRNAIARQQIERDVDVRLADEFAHHLNHDVLRFGCQRQRHQQRC